MKEILLTEFVEFADQAYPDARRDPGGRPGDPPDDGGSDGDTERRFLALAGRVGDAAGRSRAEVLRRFGAHLFWRFAAIYPVFFRGPTDPLAFLARVHADVHGSLRLFHPEASLPELRCSSPAPGRLVLDYRSERPLADLAEGLVEGCVEFFGGGVEVTREDPPDGAGRTARFVLVRPDGRRSGSGRRTERGADPSATRGHSTRARP